MLDTAKEDISQILFFYALNEAVPLLISKDLLSRDSFCNVYMVRVLISETIIPGSWIFESFPSKQTNLKKIVERGWNVE